MMLYDAANDKKKYRKQVKNELNCSNCRRNKNNSGNCEGYRKDCVLYVDDNKPSVNWGKFSGIN